MDGPDGATIVVHVQNDAPGAAPWRAGDEVSCVLEPDSVFPLRA